MNAKVIGFVLALCLVLFLVMLAYFENTASGRAFNAFASRHYWASGFVAVLALVMLFYFEESTCRYERYFWAATLRYLLFGDGAAKQAAVASLKSMPCLRAGRVETSLRKLERLDDVTVLMLMKAAPAGPLRGQGGPSSPLWSVPLGEARHVIMQRVEQLLLACQEASNRGRASLRNELTATAPGYAASLACVPKVWRLHRAHWCFANLEMNEVKRIHEFFNPTPGA